MNDLGNGEKTIESNKIIFDLDDFFSVLKILICLVIISVLIFTLCQLAKVAITRISFEELLNDVIESEEIFVIEDNTVKKSQTLKFEYVPIEKGSKMVLKDGMCLLSIMKEMSYLLMRMEK